VAHSPQQGSTVRNHLLAALSPEILSPLLPKFSSVDLPVRQVPHAPEAPIEAVYFPQTGMVSLVAGMEEGGQGEVGVIGREGMVGLPLVMGVEDAFIEAAEDKLAAPARLLRDPALLAAHRGTRCVAGAQRLGALPDTASSVLRG
jgi:CRP-like cAMP-binding protein